MWWHKNPAEIRMSEVLLNGKRPMVTMDMAADTQDWVAELTFEKATRHDLRLCVEALRNAGRSSR